MGFRPQEAQQAVLSRRREDARALDYLHTDLSLAELSRRDFRALQHSILRKAS